MLLLKATLLWTMALAGAALLRKAHAADRHRLWTIGFVAVLLLPLLTATLPSLDVPVPAWPAANPARNDIAATAPTPRDVVTRAQPPSYIRRSTNEAAAVTSPASSSPRAAWRLSWPSVRSMLLAVWAIGTGGAIAMVFVSLMRVSRLRRIGEELEDESWRKTADSLGVRLGLRRRARLLVHHSVTTPMAGGVWDPVVFLPASALSWPPKQRTIVLAHELAHLRGRDPLRLVAARLAVALYWFHPLAWLAARQSSVAREQACDAAVLGIGTRPSDYARVLLDFAEVMSSPTPAFAALPIVEPALLEMRLMEILKDDRRQVSRSRILLPLTLAAGATLTVATARPLATAVLPVSAPVPARSGPSLPAHPSLPQAPVTVPASATLTAPAPQRRIGDLDCRNGWRDGSFSGTMTSNGSNITQQIGASGDNRVIMETFGDMRVCMVAENADGSKPDAIPSQWIGHADRVVMETGRDNSVQRLTLEGTGSAQRVSWTVNGAEHPFDAAAQQWRDRLLGLLDLTWQISSVRGHVSSLRGEISSIQGQRSSLQGQISSLQGEVSSMRGRQSSIRGNESSLEGQISSIRGHVSSLQGQISSEQGAISSLDATRYNADASERNRVDAAVARHQDEIKRIEGELRDYNEDAKIALVEKEIKALDTDGKVRQIDDDIRQFNLDGKVAKIEQQIKDLDVEGKTAAIQKQIDGLDANNKVRDLESRLDKARRDLESAVSRIR